MEELVRLYCALANDGRLQDLHLTMKGDQPSHDRRVISPEASFLTLDMLAEAPRPFESEPTRSVAWKTGTSHGFRDAWAVGVFDHYVLAVWIGNFDGKGNPAFVGRSCAGPLLFRIIDAMAAGGRARLSPFAAPKGCNLRRVDFCAVSGQLPGDHCDETRSGWFIPGVSPIRRCDVHREILVDRTTGLRVTRDDGSCRREVFECWPSNLLKLFDEAGLARRTPPPFRPDSGIEIPSRSGNAPRILSPSGTAGFAAGESGIPLVATADAGVKRIYWFSDQTFLGCTAPGECLGWRAPPGRHTLLALDDNGRSAQKSFDVRATFAVASRMDEFVVGFRQ